MTLRVRAGVCESVCVRETERKRERETGFCALLYAAPLSSFLLVLSVPFAPSHLQYRKKERKCARVRMWCVPHSLQPIPSVMPCSLSLLGRVMGRRAEGLTAPNSTSANALPASCPGMKLVTMASTESRQGVRKAPRPHAHIHIHAQMGIDRYMHSYFHIHTYAHAATGDIHLFTHT